jgi:hypothetical protein
MIIPPTSHELIPALSAHLDGGGGAVLVLVKFEDGAPSELRLRSTAVSTVTLHEAALFLVEQTIRRAKSIADGSGQPLLPHLVDARHSLEAALEAITEPGAPAQTIGRA